MNIVQHSTSFFTRTTTPRPPVGIVLHNTVSTGLATPTANGSWHYEVGRDGSCHQYVPDAGYAWHVRACDRWRPGWMVNRDSRVSEANSCTIGIELVSYVGNTAGVAVPEPYTASQYDTLRALLALLYERYGILPVVGHGQLQLDRSDPVALGWGRAGLMWRGDGYRYEGEQEDMTRVQELQTQVDSLNGVNTELQHQVDALREEVSVRTQERDALQGLTNTYEPRLRAMEEALRVAVATAAKRPKRVEVVLEDDSRAAYVPEAA